MDALNGLSVVSMLIAALLAAQVFISNPKDPVNRVFVWACILLVYTAFTELGVQLAATETDAQIWHKVSAFWLLLIASILHFSIVFTKGWKHSDKWWLYALIYIPAIVFSTLDVTVNVLDAQLISESWGRFYLIGTGAGSITLAIWITAIVMLSIWLLWRYLRSVDISAEKKKQTRAVIAFISYVAIIGLVTDLFLPLFGVNIPRITTLNFMIGSLLVWYGILKHRLFTPPLERHTEAILANMSDMVFICDLDCNIVKVNAAVTQVSGQEQNDLVGRNIQDIVKLEQPEACEILVNDEIEDKEALFITGDNRQLPLSLSVSHIHDEDGKTISYVAVARDMRERIKQTETIKQHLQKQQELSKSLEEQIARRVEYTDALVHELKTPLTSVIASSGLLVSEAKDSITTKLANNILKGSKNLDRRIGQLLDMARDEEGRLKIEKKPMELEPLIREILSEFEDMADRNGISVNVNIVDGINKIMADRNRLEQVIFNLLSNAFKWTTGNGSITISAMKEDGSITISVSDTGIGISKDKLKRIFDRYYVGDDGRRTLSGLVIGLSLARSIVEKHGGKIWAESNEEKGSMFSFTLPIKSEPKSDDEE